MERLIYQNLLKWASQLTHKPLMIRGARQVGKTHTIRLLGKNCARFHNFIEINFEKFPDSRQIFRKDLDARRIIRDLSLLVDKEIIPGKTLLFLDEIQEEPLAITALRYFYEDMPDLHVIAAGSLLDFALEKIGIPVGRVSFLFMYPLSFVEFLTATGNSLLAQEVLKHQPNELLSEVIHSKLLALFGIYNAVGGMPEAVKTWIETEDKRDALRACNIVHNDLINTYRQDFQKYAKKHQIRYLDLLLDKVPMLLAQTVKFSSISNEYRKRELIPCLELLVKAGIIHQVFCTSGNGIPLRAEANPEKFKLIFLDIALAQTILGANTYEWILKPQETFLDYVNKGFIAEAVVGQELLAYSSPESKQFLYYWLKEDGKNNQAEIDYLIQKEDKVIPIEVKSVDGRGLKSMRKFLEARPKSPYGVRFSANNYSVFDRILSYPLYAVAGVAKSQV